MKRLVSINSNREIPPKSGLLKYGKRRFHNFYDSASSFHNMSLDWKCGLNRSLDPLVQSMKIFACRQ